MISLNDLVLASSAVRKCVKMLRDSGIDTRAGIEDWFWDDYESNVYVMTPDERAVFALCWLQHPSILTTLLKNEIKKIKRPQP